MRHLASFISCVVLLAAATARADFIHPVSATVGGNLVVDGDDPAKLISQATDTSYANPQPTTHAEDTWQWLATVQPDANARVEVTFDLGGVYNVTGFHAWRWLRPSDLQFGSNYLSANQFYIYGSATGEDGSWNLIHFNGNSTDHTHIKLYYGLPNTVQTRTWADMLENGTFGTTTELYPNNAQGIQYVQFQFTNSYSGPFGTGKVNVGLGELAFEGTLVPEPGAFVLLALGLTGLLAYAWRKRR